MRARFAFTLAASLLLIGGANPHAHVGGHATAAAGWSLWTEPATGVRLPGSMLFVANGAAHIEDVAGGEHVWPIGSLVPEDRERVDDFVRRIAQLNRPHPSDRSVGPRPPRGTSEAALVLSVLAVLIAARSGLASSVRVRLWSGLACVAILWACGSSDSSTGPSGSSGNPAGPSTTQPTAGNAPTLAGYFTAFPQHVRTREDAQALYVESDGLADHQMMAGIRSWQQQVPLPADYTGDNAWTIPRSPRLADQPVSARTGLFRGAIALAVNGVPIFNALNNRGDDAFLAGELDDFGGHSGRADDYHYHTAPLFLSSTVGATRPIGVALDGFLLYGSLEPDGASMRALDDYNGHADTTDVYHYHGTRTYPYINGGMKGVVRVSDQVEPQPSVRPVRAAGTPLNGATVTRHTQTGPSTWLVEYQIAGRTFRIDYRIDGTRVTFVFTDPTGSSRTEVYTR